MNKFVLLNDEKVLHEVKFSKHVLLYDFLFLLIISFINRYFIYNNWSNLSFILIMLVFIPYFIKTIFNIIRIIFFKIYITNFGIIYQKSYFSIKSYNLSDIVGVFIKTPIFNKSSKSKDIRFQLKSSQKLITLKKIKNGEHVAKLISTDLIKRRK